MVEAITTVPKPSLHQTANFRLSGYRQSSIFSNTLFVQTIKNVPNADFQIDFEN